MKEEGQRDNRTDCNLFGVGYDWTDERCRMCARVNECMIQSEHERNQINAGVQPNIPIATEPIPKSPSTPSTSFRTSAPIITPTDILVGIRIRFRKEWLKRILGEEYYDKIAKGMNAEFIFKIREQIRKQFANRPEILAELDSILGGF